MTLAMNLSDWKTMVECKGAFSLCSRQEINEQIESLVQDWILPERLKLHILDDIQYPEVDWLKSRLGAFDAITLIDEGFMSRRTRERLTRQVFDAPTDPDQRLVIGRMVETLEEVLPLSVGGGDPGETGRFCERFFLDDYDPQTVRRAILSAKQEARMQREARRGRAPRVFRCPWSNHQPSLGR